MKYFHFFHSYKLVGGKFIAAYFPDFFNEDGLQSFIICQNTKCKCGKEIQYKHEIKGDDYLTKEIVEELIH